MERVETNDNFHLNHYFEQNNSPILTESKVFKTNKNSDDETIKKIIDVLDTKIRPAVAKDGGDIKFKSFEGGIKLNYKAVALVVQVL